MIETKKRYYEVSMGAADEEYWVAFDSIVNKIKNLLTSENEKFVEEGVKKSLALIPLYPEILEVLFIPLASGVWRCEKYQIRFEEMLSELAKTRPTCFSLDAFYAWSKNESWYVRWLVLWILNNISYRNPTLVPMALLEELRNDKKWWNQEFAETILNRVMRVKMNVAKQMLEK